MPLGAHKAAMMGTAGVSTADVVLIQSQIASNSASISFTSGINSTYKEYVFVLYTTQPVSSGGQNILFQCSTDGGSNYNIVTTSTSFRASHNTSGTSVFGYVTSYDQAQGTAYQQIGAGISEASSYSYAGELHLFNPSSTTYVKHYYARGHRAGTYSQDSFTSGYFNTATALNAIDFKFASGNINAGTIKMWGVK